MRNAFGKVGLKTGQVVFCHSNIGYFGFPEGGNSVNNACRLVHDAFMDVLGDEGTLIVPTFSYSFPKNLRFDVEKTAAEEMGVFSEWIRTHPDSKRTVDPILSVAAIGNKAEELTHKVSNECFGENSFWDRFYKADGIICNLNFDAGSTFVHYVEKSIGVPYRYDKMFPGVISQDGREWNTSYVYFCRDLSNPASETPFEIFDSLARKEGLIKTAKVGRGSIVSITAKDTYSLIKEKTRETPFFLTRYEQVMGDEAFLSIPETERFNIELPENSDMMQMIETLWRLPRDLVSDGYDAALEALSRQIPMTIHEYPTGTHCWSWIVPEKWTCEEGYLETLDGKQIFSYEDNPLHVISYSQPFEGEVSREELFRHLHTHKILPDATSYGFAFYKRDWGLCCSQKLKQTLTDEKYRVCIKSRYNFGALKVGEVVIPGESDQSVMLCAHLDHPAMVNDDLVGVVLGIEAMRRMSALKKPRYTYRFLIVPETIGSIAYLSGHEDLIQKMKCGLFLEMLGLNQPHALQLSYSGDTEFDQVCSYVLKNRDPACWIGKLRDVIGNDERQFNSPGVRVPMLSLSRVLKKTEANYPYAEYHSSQDDIETLDYGKLEESLSVVMEIIDTFEKNVRPDSRFKGEVFLTRYGLHVDWFTDKQGAEALSKIMDCLDGSNSILDIAKKLNIPFEDVYQIVESFHASGLVSYL